MIVPVYDLSIISNIPVSVHSVLPPRALSTRPQPLFAIGVHDIPFLEREGRTDVDAQPSQGSNSDGVAEAGHKGWIACSTDDVLAMKTKLYDVLVTLPPAYSEQAKGKVWPKIESPRSKTMKATQRDMRRYRAFRRTILRCQAKTLYPFSDAETDSDTSPLLQQTCDEAFDDAGSANEESLVEPMSWPALAYSSFMWWASAGEKRTDLDEEMERDALLFENLSAFDSSPSTTTDSSAKSKLPRTQNTRSIMPEMVVIAYFHRLTASIFSTLADIVDCSNDDEETLVVTTEELTAMGLDIWSDGDRQFVEDILHMYFGRKADVQGAKVECCGVRIC